MKLPGFITHGLIVLVIIGGNVTSHAATYTWDVATGDSAITEGAGTWQVGAGNWFDGTSYDQNWANGNQANFGGGSAGTAGTVTLGSDVTASKVFFAAPSAGSYTIDVGSYTLNAGNVGANCGGSSPIIQASGGGCINLTGGGVWGLTTGGGILSITAQITGNNRIYTTGAGNLTLSNPTNDFTGVCQKQNGGAMRLSSINNIGVPSSAGAGNLVGVGYNGQLRYTGTGDTTDRTLRIFGTSSYSLYSSGSGAIVFAGPFQNDSAKVGGQTFNIRGGNTSTNEIRGAMSDNGSSILHVRKIDAGKWILGGTNTYTGNTRPDAGTLVLADDAQLYFVIGASNVNNKVYGDGGGTFQCNGDFLFDLSGASTTLADKWTIVNPINLAESYGSTFEVSSVSGIVREWANGIWYIHENGVFYEFSEATGVLTVIPPPGSIFGVY